MVVGVGVLCVCVRVGLAQITGDASPSFLTRSTNQLLSQCCGVVEEAVQVAKQWRCQTISVLFGFVRTKLVLDFYEHCSHFRTRPLLVTHTQATHTAEICSPVCVCVWTEKRQREVSKKESDVSFVCIYFLLNNLCLPLFLSLFPS